MIGFVAHVIARRAPRQRTSQAALALRGVGIEWGIRIAGRGVGVLVALLLFILLLMLVLLLWVIGIVAVGLLGLGLVLGGGVGRSGVAAGILGRSAAVATLVKSALRNEKKGRRTSIRHDLAGCWRRRRQTGRLADRAGSRRVGAGRTSSRVEGGRSCVGVLAADSLAGRSSGFEVGSPAVGRSIGLVAVGTLGRRERGSRSGEDIGCMGLT